MVAHYKDRRYESPPTPPGSGAHWFRGEVVSNVLEVTVGEDDHRRAAEACTN